MKDDYLPETYPRFNMKEETILKWNLYNYLLWQHLPKFEYTDRRYECYDCEYEASKVLGNGDVYLGQWKNGQLYGRGALLNTDGTSISEGYFKDGIFVGKRRQITSRRISTEWDIEDKPLNKEF